MADQHAGDPEFDKKLRKAIALLKSRPGWQLAESLARVQVSLLTSPALEPNHAARAIKTFDTKAEIYLKLVDDAATLEAYTCLLLDFQRAVPINAIGEDERQRFEQQLEARMQYWRDQARDRALRTMASHSPEERLAAENEAEYQKHGPLAPLARLSDKIGLALEQLEGTPSGPQGDPDARPQPVTVQLAPSQAARRAKLRIAESRHAEHVDADVAKRTTIIRQNSKKTAQILCRLFDLRKVPLPRDWQGEFGVKTWSDAYKNKVLRRRIDTLISKTKRTLRDS